MNTCLPKLMMLGIVAIVQPGIAQTIKVPPVPPQLEPPDGHAVFLKGSASGTQNYICLPAGSGFAWSFLGPQATLFVTFKWINGDVRQQITTHFLSPNPAEGGKPRATWQSSLDTSAVWAAAIASSTDPQFVAPGAVPWLLLKAVGTQNGPSGGEILSRTSYIQRLMTSGGIAPSTGCSESSHIGSTALVPYTTDYYFYKSNER